MKTEVVIVGAGVVGCAVAESLSRLGYEVIIVEKGPRIAEGITSRNSGVIHAGLYYTPGSLKAQFCIRGNTLLYEWCAAHSVPHLKIGKWVIASSESVDELERLYLKAAESGAHGICLKKDRSWEQENPDVSGVLGLWSPETGIVDPAALSRSLLDAAEGNGALCVTHAIVTHAEAYASEGYRLTTSRGEIEAAIVVNCAGMESDRIAALPGGQVPRIYPCRGDYFRLAKRAKAKNLIYPTKRKGDAGLGVHLTLGLDGSMRLGPDVTYVESREDFGEPVQLIEKQRKFAEAASVYLKGISPSDLVYDTCGIRPKLRAPQDPKEIDFFVEETLPGWFNFVGIESPGLTSALALAEWLSKRI